MSQVTEYVIGDSPLTMAQLKTSLDSFFAAVGSGNKGSTAPSNPFDGMVWIDDSSDPWLIKIYGSTNGWTTTGSFNDTTGAYIPYIEGVAVTSGSPVNSSTVTPSSDADHTLSSAENVTEVLSLNLGNWTADRNIIVDGEKRIFYVFNTSSTLTATIKTSGGTGIPVAPGTSRIVYCDGTNVVDPQNAMFYGVSFSAPIEKGTGDTVNLPVTNVNVPVTGALYTIQAETDWDPTTASNRDSSFTSLSIGDDVRIYAVIDGSSAKYIASLNTDYPDTYDATNSRVIGGFHVGKVRDIADAYDSAASLSTEIVWNSVWDLWHRPRHAKPAGMVDIGNGVWMDIYLASEGSGTWPNIEIVSAYNAVPLTGTEGYNRYYDYIRLARNVGKRLSSYPEMIVAAYGVPEGATGNTARQNTGDHTGYGFEAVSCLNIDQPAGNVYQSLIEIYDRSTGTGWKDDLNTGKDSAEQHGQWNGGEMCHPLFGGNWTHGAEAGSRCVNMSADPWTVNTVNGLRAVCDGINLHTGDV